MMKFNIRKIKRYFLSSNLSFPFNPFISSNIFLAKFWYCFFLYSSLNASKTMNRTFAIFLPSYENISLARPFTKFFIDFSKESMNCGYLSGVTFPISIFGYDEGFITNCYFDSFNAFSMIKVSILSWLF